MRSLMNCLHLSKNLSMKMSKNAQKNISMAVICLLVGYLLFLTGWTGGRLSVSLIISLGIGFTIRYSKIWITNKKPDMNLSIRYLLAFLVAISLWGLLPISIRYHFNPELVSAAIGNYAILLLIGSMVAAIVSYLYYRNEQFYLLQQALDKAEIVRVKQDKEMLATKLRLLQSQIEPHFLFNTLANIQALINMEPRTASKMLTALTAMLRQSLNRTRDEWLTLSHELRFNKAYLAIQQIRLGDRLRIHFEISDKILDTMQFPPMLIQPLIENAVIHGIEPLAQGGDLTLKIDVNNNVLKITVSNDCPIEDLTSHHKGHNVGLNNIKERLSQLYADKSVFFYDAETEGRVTVKMEVPIHVSN